MKSITVLGIMVKDTGLLWNRAHKKFLPLSQNTLFLKNMGQYKRCANPLTQGWIKQLGFARKNIAPVEIEIKIKEQNDDR